MRLCRVKGQAGSVILGTAEGVHIDPESKARYKATKEV
jgi:hypothetical protein